jgi:large subunit ribosomal protein L4
MFRALGWDCLHHYNTMKASMADLYMGRDENVVRATANLEQAKTTYVNTLNVYDILNVGKVVLTKAALQCVEEVYA